MDLKPWRLNTNMSPDTSLVTFKYILNFVNDLSDFFGNKHKPLKLYKRLVTQTTLAHSKPIQKHIEAFKLFCVTNREAILSKNAEKFTMNEIKYSNNVYINMSTIFKLADEDNEPAIWNHLLTISAIVDPIGKAKELLKQEATDNETEFLDNMLDKVGETVQPSGNPMEAIQSVMQSGVFGELISSMTSGMQNGELDLSKMMGTVQKLVTTISGSEEEGQKSMEMINGLMGDIDQDKIKDGEMPDFGNIMKKMMSNMNMDEKDIPPGMEDMIKGMENGEMPDLGNMMKGMNLGKGGENGVPDLSGITSMLGPLLQNLGGGNGLDLPSIMNGQIPLGNESIEDQIQRRVEEARENGEL